MNTKETSYRVFYLNDSKSRWINVDSLGNKDKIVLSTKSGKLETRTCQLHILKDNIEYIKITYNKITRLVTKGTILEDTKC